jgi:hypothetical protein
MPVSANKFGPGTLKLGPTATAIDYSCQVTALQVEWDKDTEDPLYVLCGETVPGGTTYSATLTGTVLQDLDGDPVSGLVFYTWANKGNVVAFEFIPNNDIGAKVTGSVVIDPLSVGGDEYAATMTSEFEWDIVGVPTLTPGAAAPGAGAATALTPLKDAAKA